MAACCLLPNDLYTSPDMHEMKDTQIPLSSHYVGGTFRHGDASIPLSVSERIERARARLSLIQENCSRLLGLSKNEVGAVKANLEVGAEVLTNEEYENSSLCSRDIWARYYFRTMWADSVLAGKCPVYGAAGCHADARKCEKIKSDETGVNSVNSIVTQDWDMDSGATMHACDSKEKFLTYTPVVANNAQADVAGIGTVLLRLTSGESVILKDVLHMPTINKCRISVSKLTEDGFGGEAGRYADARKCEKMKSGQTAVNSAYVIEHLSASAQVSFTDTTMRAGRQTVSQGWYMDSGATIHVCDSLAKFLTYSPVSGWRPVVVANNAQADVAGIGTVVLILASSELLILNHVHHVPTINKCLISVSKLNEDGYGVNFEAQKVVIYTNGRVIGDGYSERGMYRLNINNDPTGASTSGTVSEAR